MTRALLESTEAASVPKANEKELDRRIHKRGKRDARGLQQ